MANSTKELAERQFVKTFKSNQYVKYFQLFIEEYISGVENGWWECVHKLIITFH